MTFTCLVLLLRAAWFPDLLTYDSHRVSGLPVNDLRVVMHFALVLIHTAALARCSHFLRLMRNRLNGFLVWSG